MAEQNSLAAEMGRAAVAADVVERVADRRGAPAVQAQGSSEMLGGAQMR